MPDGAAAAAGRLATSLAVAVGFLTRIPLRSAPRPRPDDLVRAAVLFPVVGAALGGVVGGTAAALALALPAFLAAILALALEVVLTGALHLDGLADSADGLAGRDRDHALAIMRDHSVGAYGMSAIALDLLARAAALGALADAGEVWTIAAAFSLSRAAPLPLAALLPYARTGEGTGQLLADRIGPVRALVGVGLASLLAAVAVGTAAAAMLACLAVASGAIGWLARRRLGGVTGDVMGAAIEVTAAFALIVAVALRA